MRGGARALVSGARDPRARTGDVMKRVGLVVLLLSISGALPAVAQPPDAVLVNGKIVTLDARSSVREALAIRDGKITALGPSAQIRKLAGPATRVVDLGGRTAIPGLIDSHLHAIRAALSFTSEVNWIGARSLTEAMLRIGVAARSHEPGAWLIVAGGWNELQFAERRRPTQAELESAAPGSPVYVQLGYGWALLSDAGLAKLGIKSDADLPAGGKLERDAAGKPTGAITGGNNAIVALFDRLPRPTYVQQVEGTKAFFRELNRLGLTGVVDPGGNNLFPSDYRALFDVWRHHEMTVRVAYSLNGQTAGHEKDELAQLTELLPMGFGDDYLKFNGIGERITLAMNNNPAPSEADKERYYEIAKWAAERGLALTMHWGPDATVDQLLGIFERVNRDVADSGTALVDRAFERCVRQEPRADGRARGRLDRAGRNVLRRRRARARTGTRRGQAHPAGRDRQAARRRDRRGHRCAPRRVVQPVHGAAVVRGRQEPSAASRSAGQRKRRAARMRCASTRSAAPGSRTMKKTAARSRSASSPI